MIKYQYARHGITIIASIIIVIICYFWENISNYLYLWYEKYDDKEITAVVSVYSGDTQFGTGFYISKNTVITNAHVVRYRKDIKVCNKLIKCTNAKIVKRGNIKTYDIAILETESINELNPLKFARHYQKNDEIKIYGYWHNKFLNMDKHIDSQLYSDGIINRIDAYSKPEAVYTNAPIYNGASGSPILNKNNEIVGIVCWGKSRLGEYRVKNGSGIGLKDLKKFVEEPFFFDEESEKYNIVK